MSCGGGVGSTSISLRGMHGLRSVRNARNLRGLVSLWPCSLEYSGGPTCRCKRMPRTAISPVRVARTATPSPPYAGPALSSAMPSAPTGLASRPACPSQWYTEPSRTAPLRSPISFSPWSRETNTLGDSHIAKIDGRFQSLSALHAFQKYVTSSLATSPPIPGVPPSSTLCSHSLLIWLNRDKHSVAYTNAF